MKALRNIQKLVTEGEILVVPTDNSESFSVTTRPHAVIDDT